MPETSTVHQDLLNELVTKVGNYFGYVEMQTRHQSDKRIRMHLIDKIDKLVALLNVNYKATIDKDQIRLDELLQNTQRKLRTINQSLKSPTYIEESFFQSAALPAQRLERIYELEKGMLDETEHISLELSDLSKEEKDRETFQDHFLHIDTFVDNINQALFEREALILGDD